jgi:HK97 family phage major capsid protein/HK97 family phage prohead protease
VCGTVEFHAYTHLEVKALDATARTIRGIASTPNPDREGHVFDPLGARFVNPIPLLLHHDQKQPVGQATLTATKAGLLFEATIANVSEPGPLRDRLEDTWQQLQAGLLNKASIGFRVLHGGAERLKSGLLRLFKTEVCELSLTTLPVNAEAVVLTVKSLDATCFAPGLPPAAPRKGRTMTTAEQIADCETRRATNVARMTSILEDDRLEESRQKEYDALQAEVTDLDARLPRLRTFEKTMAATATPVDFPASAPVRTATTMPHIRVTSNLPPGTSFVRYCKAMLAAKGNRFEAIEIAKEWRDTPEVELILRAATNPATTGYTPYAGALVPGLTYLGSEFIDLLRPATLLGRIPGLQSVPFNVKVPRQTADGLVAWVSEGAPKPVSALAFDSVSLGEYKMAQILVFTQELARNSSPRAEDTFRRSMVAGMQKFMDQQFIDPAVAQLAGNHPASITNGVTGIAATTNPLADIAALLSSFVTAGIPLDGVVLLMSPSNAFVLSNRRSAMGAPDFPSVSISGGTISGVPVVTSSVCGTNIIAVVPQYILYADDGGVRIDVSQEASVQMVDNPSAPDATTVYRSFWQDNLIGLRAERFVAWIKSHASAVNMITGTAYVPNVVGAEAPAPLVAPSSYSAK